MLVFIATGIIRVVMEDNTSLSADANDTDLSCFSEFEMTRYKVLHGLRIGFSIISGICLLCMISIIVIFKKHTFFTQKLILFLAVCALSYDFIATIDVTAPTAYKSKPDLYYCYVIGFFDSTTAVSIFMAYFVLALNIFLKAVFQIHTEKLMALYVFIIFFSPLLYTWIPFIYLAFGPNVVTCWIRNRDLNDCSYFMIGDILRFSLQFVPAITVLIAVIVLMVVSLSVVKWKRKKWAGEREEKRMRMTMEKEIRPLIYYPFIIVFINIVGLISGLYEAYGTNDDVFYAIRLFSTLIYRFQGIIVCCIFVLDPETRKKLNRQEITAALKRLCRREGEDGIQEYKMKDGHSDSLPPATFDCHYQLNKSSI